MTKILWFLLLILGCSSNLEAQNQEKSRVLAITPELDTKINGVALGLMINSLKYRGDSTTTQLNGLNLELIGVGLFGPLAPSNPLVPFDVELNNNSSLIDSLILEAKKPKPYKLNGLNLSVGGLAGHEVQMNGLNISGISTITSQMKGVSIAILMNMNSVMHGFSVGLVNQSLEHRGVQLGLFNKSEKSRGIQIGLWNKNEKRSLPIINWNF